MTEIPLPPEGTIEEIAEWYVDNGEAYVRGWRAIGRLREAVKERGVIRVGKATITGVGQGYDYDDDVIARLLPESVVTARISLVVPHTPEANPTQRTDRILSLIEEEVGDDVSSTVGYTTDKTVIKRAMQSSGDVADLLDPCIHRKPPTKIEVRRDK